MSARVLLVEDSPMINGALKLLLESGGFDVTVATTAAEAKAAG
jgi:DNA-binding response OmpR family regulator